jgi:hypothetical protein
MLILLESLFGQRDFVCGCLLRLFDEGVQQDYFVAVDSKKRARDVLFQRRSNFPNGAAKMVHVRLPDRPLVLNVRNIFTNRSPIVLWQTLEPIAYRLITTWGRIESSGKPWRYGHGENCTL